MGTKVKRRKSFGVSSDSGYCCTGGGGDVHSSNFHVTIQRLHVEVELSSRECCRTQHFLVFQMRKNGNRDGFERGFCRRIGFFSGLLQWQSLAGQSEFTRFLKFLKFNNFFL